MEHWISEQHQEKQVACPPFGRRKTEGTSIGKPSRNRTVLPSALINWRADISSIEVKSLSNQLDGSPMTSLNLNLLLAAMSIFSAAAIASDQTVTQSSEVRNKDESVAYLNESDFLLQKEQMIKDIENKVEVLQAAHGCAKAAETPAAFAECNQKLRDAILGKAKK